jgi:RHS repeat-associated protein
VKSEVNGSATLMPHPLVEIDSNGEVVPWIVAEGRRLARLPRGGPVFFHADALGSTRLVTDKTGGVVGEYDYGAWGEDARVLNQGASAYRFAGSRSDPSTGLALMNARQYDSKLAHFISADPIVPDVYSPQSLNRYGYVLNDPVSSTDRSGYEVDCRPDPSGWGLDCSEPEPAAPPREPPPLRQRRDLDEAEQRRLYAYEVRVCGNCHAYDPNDPSLRPVTQADKKMVAVGLLAVMAAPAAGFGAEIVGSEALLEGSIVVYRAAPRLWNTLLAVGGAAVGIPSAGPAPAGSLDKAAQSVAVVESRVLSSQGVREELSAAQAAAAREAEVLAARAASAKQNREIQIQNWLFERYGIWSVGKSQGGSLPMSGSFLDEIVPPLPGFQLTTVGDKVMLTPR